MYDQKYYTCNLPDLIMLFAYLGDVQMEITWLGHSGFKMKIASLTFLIDPWLKNNPMFPENKISETLEGVSHCLISHAHDDHAKDVLELAKEKNITLVGIYDYISYVDLTKKVKGIGFNKGGTIQLGPIEITMVSASHSSSFNSKNGLLYGGSEVGYMITYNNRTIYFSGDTDIMADMDWFGELHNPEIGILSAGGHYTMDMSRAAFAANKYFNFKTVIPCHYKTFPVLEQDAEVLIKSLPNSRVIEPIVLETITL